MSKFLLDWTPTVREAGGDCWSKAHVQHLEVEVRWNRSAKRFELWKTIDGTEWSKLALHPAFKTMDGAKLHIEEVLLPPLERVLMKTRDNPRRKFLLPWRLESSGVYAATLPGIGRWEVLVSEGHALYFPLDGGQWEGKTIPPEQRYHSNVDESLHWAEDNLIPPLYRALLETKENPDRARRNSLPATLLRWNMTSYGFGNFVWRAHIPNVGDLKMEKYNLKGTVVYTAEYRPLVEGGMAGSVTTQTVPSSLRGDLERLQWVEETFIPPVIRVLLLSRFLP